MSQPIRVLDPFLRVLVDGFDAGHVGCFIGGKFHRQFVAQVQRSLSAEVRQPFALFLSHVVSVCLVGGSYGIKPVLAADLLARDCGDSITNFIMVFDSVESFFLDPLLVSGFATDPKESRVEDLFFGFGMNLQERGQSLPDRGKASGNGEMYVKLNGEMVYLWRAVDHEGEILESYITKTRDKAAALTFMKKTLKRHGRVDAITTDGLRSYRAAMNELGCADKQEVGRWANNRCENAHLSFRRRERAMLRFRRLKSLQKFASVHGSIHNHFNQERHLIDRQTFKERRSAALAEWQSLAS